MAFIYNVNQRQITGGTQLYNLMTTLVRAGWVVKSSGDGTGGHYSATGNILTSGGNVNFGLYLVGAWFRIQQPATSTGQAREFVIQQGSNPSTNPNFNMSLRIKYSPNPTGATGFTGGSPSASRVPSATDEQVITGGGTDASPTYQSISSTDYEFTTHIVADTGALGYSWYLLTTTEATGLTVGFQMMMDVMVAGTTTANDADPAVIYFENSGSNGYAQNMRSGSNNVVHGFFGGTASANWVSAQIPTFSAAYPSSSPSEAWTNEDTCIMLHWQSTSNAGVPAGTKGYSSLCMYHGQGRGACTVIQINPNAGGDHIYINGTLLPWPSNLNAIIS